MDKQEAKQLILTELEFFRAKPYVELVRLVNTEPVTGERTSPSGKRYQIEIQAFWDDKPDGTAF